MKRLVNVQIDEAEHDDTYQSVGSEIRSRSSEINFFLSDLDSTFQVNSDSDLDQIL